jgi:hypothetical protein
MNILGMFTGYELWLLHHCYGYDGYVKWRMTWDLTEEEDYMEGYAT